MLKNDCEKRALERMIKDPSARKEKDGNEPDRTHFPVRSIRLHTEGTVADSRVRLNGNTQNEEHIITISGDHKHLVETRAHLGAHTWDRNNHQQKKGNRTGGEKDLTPADCN